METYYENITKKVLVKHNAFNFFFFNYNFSLVTMVLEPSGKFLLDIGDMAIFMIYFSEPSL